MLVKHRTAKGSGSKSKGRNGFAHPGIVLDSAMHLLPSKRNAQDLSSTACCVASMLSGSIDWQSAGNQALGPSFRRRGDI